MFLLASAPVYNVEGAEGQVVGILKETSIGRKCPLKCNSAIFLVWQIEGAWKIAKAGH